MRYGQPKIFALQCLVLRIWAQALFDARRAFDFHMRVGRKLASGAAAFAFLCSSIYFVSLPADSNPQGSDVFGHYATFWQYDGPRYPLPDAPAIALAYPIAYVEGLSSGHRCLARARVVTAPAPRCLASDATPREKYEVKVPEQWSATCCTLVAAGSEHEPLSWTRRFFLFIGMPRNGGLWSALFAAFMVAMLAAAAAGTAILALSPVTALLLLALTIASNVTALLRLLSTLYLTARRLPVQSWPNTPVSSPWLVQLTDLHVAAGLPYELQVDPAAYTSEEPAPSGTELDLRLVRVLRKAARLNPACLALTGDITDCGSWDEWQRFEGIWRSVFSAGVGPAVMMVPGNHDVSFNKCETPDPGGENKFARECQFLSVERRLSGRSESETGKEEFPLVQSVEGNHGPVHIVSLNSCRYDSHFILSNAVGRLGRDQLATLDHTLDMLSGPLVVLLHHHLALQPGRLSWRHPLDSAQELMKMPVDARELIHLLSAYARRHPVLVIHGHQHENLRLTVDGQVGGRIHVFGLASSTLGHVDPKSDLGHAALDGRLRIGLIDFDPATGWSAEALVVEKG